MLDLKAQWRAAQARRRGYADEVLARIEPLRARFDVVPYGHLDYGADQYDLFAVRSRAWDPALPTMLVTGGVHGYETSGVQGALQFLEQHAAGYAGRANLLVVPVMGAVVMPAGVIAAVLGPLGLAGPALWAMGLGTRWMLFVGERVADWGGAVLAVPAPPVR